MTDNAENVPVTVVPAGKRGKVKKTQIGIMTARNPEVTPIADPKRDKDAADWQERHSPTDEVMVRIDAKRNTQLCRRRKTDARLFDALDPDQERAAAWIVIAFEHLTGPVAVKVGRLERVPAGIDDARDFVADASSAYLRWGRDCLPKGISHAAVMDVLAYGKSARQVDRVRRKRKGWTMENLLDGLTLFCKLQGWKHNALAA